MLRFYNISLFAIIFILYSNFIPYFNKVGILHVPPFVFYIICTIFLLTLSLWVHRSRLELHQLIIFTIFIILFSSLMFIFNVQTTNGTLFLLTEFYLLAFLSSIYFIFVSSEKNVTIGKYAILLSCILSVIVNVYHFLHPLSMLPPELAIPGRAAGFFVNPNASGIALALGLILVIDIVPVKYKEIFTISIIIGIIITFSRGAILSVFIIMIIMLHGKILSFRNLSIILFLIVLFLPMIASSMINIALEDEQFNISNIMKRIDWFQTFGKASDFSARERTMVALKSIEYMDMEPLLGIGISRLGSWTTLPHNMYFLFGVRYGILGIMIYPIFVLSCTLTGWEKNKLIYVPFIVAMLLFGLVSHDMMRTYFVLIAAAMVAALGTLSRQNAEDKTSAGAGGVVALT